MNKMSDDLISRKAVYKAFSDYLNRSFLAEISSQTELSIGEIASVIKSVPTAFDKEKVIEKLNSGRFVTVDGVTVGESTSIRIDRAVEIVEKGGIK